MCWLFCVSGSLLVSSSVAFAARSSVDPIVVIAIVSTIPLSACTDTVTFNSGTSHAFTKREPCEKPGIQVTSDHVHLSQALEQHEPYVLLPSANASQAIL